MNRTLSLLIVSLFLLGPLTALPVNAQPQFDIQLYFRDASFAIDGSADLTEVYGEGGVAFIYLYDPTKLEETQTIFIKSIDPDFGGAPLEVEQVVLQRWAPGEYRGVIGFETTAVANNGQVAVIDSAQVIADYNGGGGRSQSAGLNWFESRTATVEVAPYHVGQKAEILVTVTDPDGNLDPRAREYIPRSKVLLISDTQQALIGSANHDFMPSMGDCNFDHLPQVAGECNNPNFKGFKAFDGSGNRIDDAALLEYGLQETGRDTGVFTGTFMVEVLDNAQHVNDGFVLVEGDEHVSITYSDDHDARGHSRDVETSTRWQQTYPGIPEMFRDEDYREPIVAGDKFEGLGTIYIRLTDLDKKGAGTIKVRAASSSTGVTGLFVNLKESGLDTGEFLGQVELTTQPSFTKLKVANNDKLYISYEDDLNELGQVGTAVRFPDIADLDPLTGCGAAGPGASQAEIDRTGCVRWFESATAQIKFTEYFDWDPSVPNLLPNDTPVTIYYGSATDPSANVGAEDQEGVAVNVHVFDNYNEDAKSVHITSDIDPYGFVLDLQDDASNAEIARATFFLKEPSPSQFTEADYFDSAPLIPFRLSDPPSVADPPRLYVRDGSEIYATFVDSSDADGDEREVEAVAIWKKTQTGEIFIDAGYTLDPFTPPSVDRGQLRPNVGSILGDEAVAKICVFDPDADLGSTRDEVQVDVFSQANPDPGITMTLKEVAPVGLSGTRNTGLFCGTLSTSVVSSGTGRVMVPNAPGYHKINVRYIDKFDESGNQKFIVNWVHDNDQNDVMTRRPVYLEWRQEIDPNMVSASNPSAEDTQAWMDAEWYNMDMWQSNSVRAEVTFYVGTEVPESDLPDERTLRISSSVDYVDLEVFRVTGSRYMRGFLEMTNDPESSCTSCGDNADEILRIGVAGDGTLYDDTITIVDTPDTNADPGSRWGLKTFRDPDPSHPDARWRNGGAPQHGATQTPPPPPGSPRAPMAGLLWQGSVFPPELCGVGTGPVFLPDGSSGDAGRLDGEGLNQACIILRDIDRNLDEQVPDLTFATVSTSTNTAGEKIALMEVDETGRAAVNTGLFRGFIGFDVNQVAGGKKLVQVSHLDTVTFEYTDPVYYNAAAFEDVFLPDNPTYRKDLTWFQKYTGQVSVFQDRDCTIPVIPDSSGEREFLGTGLICVQVADNDHNTRTTETDRIWAAALCDSDLELQGTDDPEWHRVQLFETGENSGVFQGILNVKMMELDGAGMPVTGEGFVNVLTDGENCDIIYTDAEADTDNNGAFLDDTMEGNKEEFVTLDILSMTWISTQDVLQAKLCRDDDCTASVLLPDGQTKTGSIVQVFDKFSRRPIFGRGTYVIEVTDPDRFADVTPFADTIEVLVFTDSDPQGITIQLAERFGSMATSQRPRGSTEFVGEITFTQGPSIPGVSIQSEHGDEVTFRYNNPNAIDAAGESELDDIVVRDGIWRDVELGRIELLDDFYVGISNPQVQGAPPQEITLIDADRNIFADEKDWAGSFVTVYSDSSRGGFRFEETDFEETARNVGVFHERIGFNPGAMLPDSRQIGVENRDIVTFTYRDDFDLNSEQTFVQKTMRWLAEYETGWIDLDQDLYVSEAAIITVVVRDRDLSTNDNVVESAQAWVCSDSDGGCESVALFEAKESDFSIPSKASDAFVGQLGVETSFTALNDGKLYVQDGDNIIAYYTDADESALDSAIVPYAATDRAEWVLRDNVPPVAILSATPLAVEKGETVNFTVMATDNEEIVSWKLDFGDGNPVTGVDNLLLNTVYVEHFFTTNGSKAVILTVEDNRGVKDTATVTIKVGTPIRVCNPQTDPNQCGTKQIPIVDPADQFAVNKDIQTSVRVFCEGNDARITWRIPAQPPAPIVGVQMWRSGEGGYNLIATLPKDSSAYASGSYIDVDAGCKSRYKVTAYYGEAEFAGFSTGDSSVVEGFDQLKSTKYEAPNNFPWWGWLMVGLGVLLAVVLSVVYIVLRQTTKEPVRVASDEEAYAYDEDAMEMEEEVGEEEASLQQHQIRCPTCANEFTATGAKPLAVSCPQCGTRGMLK